MLGYNHTYHLPVILVFSTLGPSRSIEAYVKLDLQFLLASHPDPLHLVTLENDRNLSQARFSVLASHPSP
jgi:hypothetical protein